MKVNQKTATVNAILSVLKEHGVNYELNGSIPVSEVLTDTMTNKTKEILFAMFRSGNVEYSIEFKSKVDSDSELKKYINGLINNWVRRAREFNCGIKHEAKNPGSRAGSTDEKVKEMKKLLSITTDPTAKAMIQAAIDQRVAEVKAEKNQVEIDYSVIPAELRAKLGL